MYSYRTYHTLSKHLKQPTFYRKFTQSRCELEESNISHNTLFTFAGTIFTSLFLRDLVIIEKLKNKQHAINDNHNFIRHVSRTRRLLKTEEEKKAEKERHREKVWKQQRIVQDEFYEPDPALASGKTTVTILNKEQVCSIKCIFNKTTFWLIWFIN